MVEFPKFLNQIYYDIIHDQYCKLNFREYVNSKKLIYFLTTSFTFFQAAKGVTPITPSDFVPVVKDTVTYIALAVLFNNEGDVLLMQEAKRSCAGQWYLPAGRMEPGESIEVKQYSYLLYIHLVFIDWFQPKKVLYFIEYCN